MSSQPAFAPHNLTCNTPAIRFLGINLRYFPGTFKLSHSYQCNDKWSTMRTRRIFYSFNGFKLNRGRIRCVILNELGTNQSEIANIRHTYGFHIHHSNAFWMLYDSFTSGQKKKFRQNIPKRSDGENASYEFDGKGLHKNTKQAFQSAKCVNSTPCTHSRNFRQVPNIRQIAHTFLWVV